MKSKEWHHKEINEILAELKTSEDGLSEKEAANRVEIFGKNILPRHRAPSVFHFFISQFKNPLIYILGIAAVVSVAIGESTDAIFIAAVLLLNAIVGTIQEWQAEKSSQALEKYFKIRAIVQRDSESREIDSEDLVPGDIVWLEAGQKVPADIRLKFVNSLRADESLLTGESMPVKKDITSPLPKNKPLSDRKNMAYAGSTIANGRAAGIVVQTGQSTSIGQLAMDVMQSKGGKPPLIMRMERFTRFIAIIIVVFAIILSAYGILIQGISLTEMFLFAVALAVSAIPEGLPVAMTVALSVSSVRMAKRKVIVRKLSSVEGLGSCSMIATDKTGTLTCNELTITTAITVDGQIFGVTGAGYTPEGQVLKDGKNIQVDHEANLTKLARTAVICNESDLYRKDEEWNWRGDPVDVAFLNFAYKLGIKKQEYSDKSPRINEIPFDSDRAYAASFNELDGRTVAFVKGSPEKVLGMCRFSEKEKEEQVKRAEELAEQGLRVLALAEGPMSIEPTETPPEPNDLEFLGFVGMTDPPRENVKEAIKKCHDSGIHVSMLTGDHRITAYSIARDLGIADKKEQVRTGEEINKMSVEELKEIIQETNVYARLSPRQKLDIVVAAKNSDNFVAVTGDGVNDAPALKEANIGIAMGKSGTDVAREASDLVISDDNFSSIVAGIEEGRIAYDNIRKVIYLLVSTGAAEMILMTAAIVFALPIPLLPVQLLWLNLVTNGIQDIALAFEPPEKDILKRKPRPKREKIFNRLMIERTLVAAIIMATVGFSYFSWMIDNGWSEDIARNHLLLLMVLFENIHIGNCRSETVSAFRISPLKSPVLLAGTLLAFGLHMTAMHFGFFQNILGVAPVDIKMFGITFICALSVFVAMELHKLSWRMRYGNKK